MRAGLLQHVPCTKARVRIAMGAFLEENVCKSSLPAADKLYNTCVRTQLEALIAKATELSIKNPAHKHRQQVSQRAATPQEDAPSFLAVIIAMSGSVCQARPAGCDMAAVAGS